MSSNSDTKKIFEDLFQRAKNQDEFAYVFALLGVNSGIEDVGWQPINETWGITQDILSIANTPLRTHTQVRLLLLLYSQITESNYMYHVLYNMLLCIEKETPPKVFNFLDQYNNGVPPSVKVKVKKICDKAVALNETQLSKGLDSIFDSSLRNAIAHADFILFENKLRLKHKGTEIREMSLNEVVQLINEALEFFQEFFQVLHEHKMSYEDGYTITDRKNKAGQNLGSATLKVDKHYGLVGFSGSDPLPLW